MSQEFSRESVWVPQTTNPWENTLKHAIKGEQFFIFLFLVITSTHALANQCAAPHPPAPFHHHHPPSSSMSSPISR